jgi:cell division control protein 12
VAAQNIKIYSPPIDPEEPAAAEHAQALHQVMPFSIIGSTTDVTTADGRTVKGREYLWGVAEGRSNPPSLYANVKANNP